MLPGPQRLGKKSGQCHKDEMRTTHNFYFILLQHRATFGTNALPYYQINELPNKLSAAGTTTTDRYCGTSYCCYYYYL